LPFIPETSYPHEILHNWWGNGVYVDYASGNWSEGLTVYLADHWLAERAGRGEEYRRAALQHYADFVSSIRDFPLVAFHARHGPVSQAVGYDKALMLFHALRLQLGDAAFVDALRRFYRNYLFHRASWADLRATFGSAANRLDWDQWLERSGAPALRLSMARAEQRAEGWHVVALLEQVQDEKPYRVTVPVAVQLEDSEQPWEGVVSMNERRLALDLALPARPWRLAVDPRFDVFRRLNPKELPSSLGRLYGTEGVLAVLPSSVPTELREAWRALAQAWGIAVVEDAALKALPTGRAVWLLGWENRFLPELFSVLAPAGVAQSATGLRLGDRDLPRADHAVVLTTEVGGATWGWVGAGDLAMVAALARKLPHYSKYSFLAFQGPEATNVLKGQWPVNDSPLDTVLAQPDGAVAPVQRMVVAPRPPLAARP
jgi:hypothetical protein